MVKPLPLSDFRALRYVLEPDDFALGDDEPDPAPSDLITEEAWSGLMTLPGDVAIRTTSFQGSRVSVLHELIDGWTEILPSSGVPVAAMLDVFNSFQSSAFSQVHGFYKEAISTLRAATETMVLAGYCVLADDAAAWKRWEDGEEVRFKLLCDQLQGLAPLKDLEEAARRNTGSTLFTETGGPQRPWGRGLYKKLSTYAHARGDSNNFQLWEGSTGPIYSGTGFAAAYQLFLEAHALCLLLAKLSHSALPLTAIAELTLRSDSLAHYLDSADQPLCRYYFEQLFGSGTISTVPSPKASI